ncbi:MAG: hypothetical protein U0T81_02975 [Saprospiraceae bacterium]
MDGNDGGLNVSKDGGKTWQFILNLPVGQFYHLNVDQQFFTYLASMEACRITDLRLVRGLHFHTVAYEMQRLQEVYFWRWF